MGFPIRAQPLTKRKVRRMSSHDLPHVWCLLNCRMVIFDCVGPANSPEWQEYRLGLNVYARQNSWLMRLWS